MLHPGFLRNNLQPDQLNSGAQFHDDRRVIGRPWLGSRPAIDLAALQALGEFWRQQEMVDTDAAIVLEGLSEVIPERELAAFVRVQRPERVGIAETEQRTISRPRLGLEQRVADPGGRVVAIDVLRN